MLDKWKVKRKCRQNKWTLIENHYVGYYTVKVRYGPTESLIDYLIADNYYQMNRAINHLLTKQDTWPKIKTVYEPPANTVHSTKQGPN